MKRKRSKGASQKRRQSRQGEEEEKSANRGFDWKFSVSTALGILGLIFAALVLESRPTISLEPPIHPHDLLSTLIVISNDGALPIEDVDAAVYIRRMTYRGGTFSDGVGTNYAPPSREMRIGDKKTIRLAPFSYGNDGSPMLYADIGLVLCYRPILIPRWIWFGGPRVFRFDSVVQADGTAKLLQQPDDGSIFYGYSKMLAAEGRGPCQAD